MFRSQSAAKVLKIVGAGFLAAILCSCSGASSSKHKIAQILLQYHRDGRFSGSALLGYGNTIVYEGAFGLADETWKIANTPTTVAASQAVRTRARERNSQNAHPAIRAMGTALLSLHP